MKISVVIPSRLQVNPISPQQNLYLDLCVGAILRQTASVELEIIVGLDRGTLSSVPARFLEPARVPILFVESDGAGQAKAVNAAAAKATGDVLAFCEDDDAWEACKLEYQLPLLERYDLVTCNQRERLPDGSFVRFNSFATPSGWVLKREAWDRVGGFDESFRFHVDTEWLGRAAVADLRRVHLVHDGYASDAWLRRVGENSAVMRTDGLTTPLVHRVVNPGGGMSTIAVDGDARAQSTREHRIMVDRFGAVPW